MVTLKNTSAEQKLAIVGSGVAGVIASLFLSQTSATVNQLNARMALGGAIGLAAGYFAVKKYNQKH